MTIEEAARGILAIVDHNMMGAIRVVSVERGHDPRDFVLVPFGGAGPLHGGSLARLMGIGTILIPPAPGVLSALGLLVSNLKAEFTRTSLQRAGAIDVSRLGTVFAALNSEAIAWLDQEAVPANARRVTWYAKSPLPASGFRTRGALGRNIGQRRHRRRHHRRVPPFARATLHLRPGRHPVEIVTLRVDAEGAFAPPTLPPSPKGGTPDAAITGEMTIASAEGKLRARVYDRTRLGAGDRISGPAVLTQLDATTLLLPGQTAEVHPLGALIVKEAP